MATETTATVDAHPPRPTVRQRARGRASTRSRQPIAAPRPPAWRSVVARRLAACSSPSLVLLASSGRSPYLLELKPPYALPSPGRHLADASRPWSRTAPRGAPSAPASRAAASASSSSVVVGTPLGVAARRRSQLLRRGVRPDPHRPAVAAVGRLGAGRDHLVRPQRRRRCTRSSCSAPCRPSSTACSPASTRCRRCSCGSAASLGARGWTRIRYVLLPAALPGLPRRPQAGLGVLLALADGRRDHHPRRLGGRPGPAARDRPRALATCRW